MASSIDRITIKGYKSIRSLEDFELRPINILIGANGAGKSNFVSFFSLLRELVEGRLAVAVNTAGGADRQLYLGPKVTQLIHADLNFGCNGYEFYLKPTVDGRLIFVDERIKFSGAVNREKVDRSIGQGHSESKLQEDLKPKNTTPGISDYVYKASSGWIVYHFHDTSETSPMRRSWSKRDNERLRFDGGNLAAFLWGLRSNSRRSFERIRDTVRLVAPFFVDFSLRPQKSNG
ncbi:MAG: recombinase RecF, partial [Planctomycetota bacterium]|nr:recombinase RecF [Planctomycetota bacterium]